MNPIILASNSPRRQQLLKDLGFIFEVKVKDTPEDFPDDMPLVEIPLYLAYKKALAFEKELGDKILITADTIVKLDNQVLNKPADAQEAYTMLAQLSGKKHEVITGVCIMNQQKKSVFTETTAVYFKNLSHQEIAYYIENYKPFDKAGSYGIQEWIGLIGIDKIEGSYFNVMGFPVHKVYEVLTQEFNQKIYAKDYSQS